MSRIVRMQSNELLLVVLQVMPDYYGIRLREDGGEFVIEEKPFGKREFSFVRAYLDRDQAFAAVWDRIRKTKT